MEIPWNKGSFPPWKHNTFPPEGVIRFLTFLHYMELKPISYFRIFGATYSIANLAGVPDGDFTNVTAASGRGVRHVLQPAVYNTGDSPLLSGAARNTRLGSGPGRTRLGGCYCFCLYFAWGTWARSLRTQLSSFFYWQIQGLGLVTDPRQVPATRGSVIHLHTHPTRDALSVPQRSLWSQKGNGHIHMDYMVPWAKWLITGRWKSTSNNFQKWLGMPGWVTEFNLKEQAV